MLSNYFYRLNKWLDNSNFTIIIVIIPILVANLLIIFGNFIIGPSILLSLSIFVILRMRIQTGQIKFDRSKYDIPKIGETVIIKKPFYWNGSFHKNPPNTGPGSKPCYYVITDEKDYIIVDIKEVDGDWYIYLKNEESLLGSTIMDIKYFESRKYWETKSNIRNNKLKKLGI